MDSPLPFLKPDSRNEFARSTRIGFYSVVLCILLWSIGQYSRAQQPMIGHFQIDATIPLDHRCMGVLPQKSKSIADSLELHGFVLLGNQDPIVVVAVDWCEIRNKSYD